MDTLTATITESKLDVPTLAERIGLLHREIKAQPGRYEEMHKLLTLARKDVGERGWLKWLTDNRSVLGFAERQARLYLREPASRDADLKAHREAQAAHRERQVLSIVPKAPEPAEVQPKVLEDDDVEPEAETTKPDSKHGWGNQEWTELTPKEQQEYRRATHVKELLGQLEATVDSIVEVAEELTAAQRERVAAVVKLLLNVVPVKFSVGHGGHLMIGEPASAHGPSSSAS